MIIADPMEPSFYSEIHIAYVGVPSMLYLTVLVLYLFPPAFILVYKSTSPYIPVYSG
jgi:hypothetical protein